MYRSRIAVFAATAFLAGCGGSQSDGSGKAESGSANQVITEAQFSEVKANCHLEGATLAATNSTETSTNANGVKMTVTTTYKDAPADGKSIQLPERMSEGEIALAIPCLKSEFERLGVVEAPLRLPASMGM
jgi:hypothetical protein